MSDGSKEGKVQLLQGNEALAEGAIAAGCRFFAGYPITPASEIAEHMALSQDIWRAGRCQCQEPRRQDRPVREEDRRLEERSQSPELRRAISLITNFFGFSKI